MGTTQPVLRSRNGTPKRTVCDLFVARTAFGDVADTICS